MADWNLRTVSTGLERYSRTAATPHFANLSPVEETELEPTTVVEFDIYDVAENSIIYGVLSNDQRPFVIWDGTAFVGLYKTTCTRTGAGTQASPHHFRVNPAGGWPRDVTLTLYAVLFGRGSPVGGLLP